MLVVYRARRLIVKLRQSKPKTKAAGAVTLSDLAPEELVPSAPVDFLARRGVAK
jgi:hypothetical protein